MEHYRPLPECLTIKVNEELTAETGKKQLGLYAEEDIPNQFALGLTHIKNSRFGDEPIRTPLGGFINHSETPNCRLIGDDALIYLITIRRIGEGEELTVKYTMYDPTK